MNSPDLITISIAAFSAVFVLLSLLALMMRLIIFLFPERQKTANAAIVAAVAATFKTLYPGTKITKIEEVQ